MKQDDKLVLKVLEIIDYFNPTLWFIENPAGSKMKDRTFMKELPNYVVDYCMYSNWGYRKRTRIWTNKKEWTPKTCDKNCGNMMGNLHRTNLGNLERAKRNNEKFPSRSEAYRVPQDLILSLLLD